MGDIMKIEVKERGSKEFYDEFLAVMQNYNNLIKKPQKKVSNQSVSILKLGIYAFITLTVYILIHLFGDLKMETYIIILFAIIFLIVIILYGMVQSKIKRLQSYKGTITIDFSKEGITYYSEKENYKLNWDDIKYIVINHYSICFLPKESMKILIGINIEYQKEVLKAIDKYQKNDMLVDNSNLYK